MSEIPLASSFPVEGSMTPRSKRRAAMKEQADKRRMENERRRQAVAKRKEASENNRAGTNRIQKKPRTNKARQQSKLKSSTTRTRSTARTTSRSKAAPKSGSTMHKSIVAKGIQKKLDEAAEEVKSLKAQVSGLETTAKQRLEEYMGKLAEPSCIVLDRMAQLSKKEEEVERLSVSVKAQSLEKEKLLSQLQETKDAAAEAESRLSLRVQELETKVLSLEERCLENDQLRRQLHNTIAELKGNIRVFCRVRPFIACIDGPDTDSPFGFEENDPELRSIRISQEGKRSLDGSSVNMKTYDFKFDKSFRSFNTNSDVNKEVAQLVQSALDGYNVSLFCYGQTGSGKTYTMEGSSTDPGIIPFSVSHLFELVANEKKKGWTSTVKASFVEIYNETLHDLLRKNSSDTPGPVEIKLKNARDGNQELMITNLSEEVVSSASDLEPLLKRAGDRRRVAATACNDRSSRSHSVFRLEFTRVHKQSGVKLKGMLHLVDLAGSERVRTSKVEGKQLKETKAINKSLSCLGDVIFALSSGQKHIPYRNSKLTYLLQNALGGNSKTLVIVNLSPAQASTAESLQTLRFGHKVNACEIGTAKRNTQGSARKAGGN